MRQIRVVDTDWLLVYLDVPGFERAGPDVAPVVRADALRDFAEAVDRSATFVLPYAVMVETGRLTLRDWMGDLRLPRRAVAISVVANEAGWYYGEREVDPGLAAPQRMPVSAIAETELIARLADLRRRLEPMQVTLDQPNPCCKDRGAYE